MCRLMKYKYAIPVWALFGLLTLLWSGCAPGGYGRLTIAGPRMTLGQLTKNWRDYHVAYAGVSVSQPNAILFAPKNAGTTITLHEYWSPVEDGETLGDLLGWMGSFTLYGPPSLYEISGPNNRSFGYLYSSDNGAIIKVIDDNTLWIDDMTLRPEVRKNILY